MLPFLLGFSYSLLLLRRPLPDDVVAVVRHQLVARQGGVHPGEDHGGRGEHDSVQAQGRDQRRGRLRLRLLVSRASRLVDGPPVTHVIVGTQADHVLAVGLCEYDGYNKCSYVITS